MRKEDPDVGSDCQELTGIPKQSEPEIQDAPVQGQCSSTSVLFAGTCQIVVRFFSVQRQQGGWDLHVRQTSGLSSEPGSALGP